MYFGCKNEKRLGKVGRSWQSFVGGRYSLLNGKLPPLTRNNFPLPSSTDDHNSLNSPRCSKFAPVYVKFSWVPPITQLIQRAINRLQPNNRISSLPFPMWMSYSCEKMYFVEFSATYSRDYTYIHAMQLQLTQICIKKYICILCSTIIPL